MADPQYLIVEHLSLSEIKRIFNNVQVDSSTGCWLWTAGKDYTGYGCVYIHGVRERIHRVVYAWTVGPIPRGRDATKLSQLDHLCKNTSCCNPLHLELVDQRTNVLRGSSIVAIQAKQTHCKYGHLLTPTKKPNRRECKTCDSNRKKARLAGPDREYWLRLAREAAQRQRNKKRAGIITERS